MCLNNNLVADSLSSSCKCPGDFQVACSSYYSLSLHTHDHVCQTTQSAVPHSQCFCNLWSHQATAKFLFVTSYVVTNFSALIQQLNE